MTGYWAIAWGGKVWAYAPAAAMNGSAPVTIGLYAQVADEIGAGDDWAVCRPDRSPLVLTTWICVLGVSAGLWADMDAARAELVTTPLATLSAALVALTGEE